MTLHGTNLTKFVVIDTFIEKSRTFNPEVKILQEKDSILLYKLGCIRGEIIIQKLLWFSQTKKKIDDWIYSNKNC